MSTEYMECVSCHMQTPATPYCGVCRAQQPKQRKQPAAYSPGGRAGSQGGWWVAGKPNGKGQGKGQYGSGQKGGGQGKSGTKGGGKGGKSQGKGGKQPYFPPTYGQKELDNAIRGIAAMSPAQANLHKSYWPAPEDKAGREAYCKHYWSVIENLSFKIAAGHRLGSDTEEDVIEVSVAKAMAFGTQDLSSQIHKCKDAVDRAIARDATLMQQMMDIKHERELNNKGLIEYQTTLAELYAQQEEHNDFYGDTNDDAADADHDVHGKPPWEVKHLPSKAATGQQADSEEWPDADEAPKEVKVAKPSNDMGLGAKASWPPPPSVAAAEPSTATNSKLSPR